MYFLFGALFLSLSLQCVWHYIFLCQTGSCCCCSSCKSQSYLSEGICTKKSKYQCLLLLVVLKVVASCKSPMDFLQQHVSEFQCCWLTLTRSLPESIMLAHLASSLQVVTIWYCSLLLSCIWNVCRAPCEMTWPLIIVDGELWSRHTLILIRVWVRVAEWALTSCCSLSKT